MAIEIAPGQIEVSDEVLAHLIPGCFNPKPGVTVDDVRQKVREVLAEKAMWDGDEEVPVIVGPVESYWQKGAQTIPVRLQARVVYVAEIVK